MRRVRARACTGSCVRVRSRTASDVKNLRTYPLKIFPLQTKSRNTVLVLTNRLFSHLVKF